MAKETRKIQVTYIVLPYIFRTKRGSLGGLVLFSNQNWSFTSETYANLKCKYLLHELSR